MRFGMSENAFFCLIAKTPEPSSKAGPFRSLNGHIHDSLTRFKCLVGTRVIISLLFEICLVALSFCYMTCKMNLRHS